MLLQADCYVFPWAMYIIMSYTTCAVYNDDIPISTAEASLAELI